MVSQQEKKQQLMQFSLSYQPIDELIEADSILL